MEDKELLKQIKKNMNDKYGDDALYFRKIIKIKKDIFDYIYEKRNKTNKYSKGIFMDEYIMFLKKFKLYNQYKEIEHKEFVNILIEYITNHELLNDIQKNNILKIINENI